MELSGRKALVTGSTSGIGLGIARSLAAEGADIYLHGLAERQEVEALISDFKARGCPGKIAFLEADLRDRHNYLQALGSIEVDILINNAGVQHAAPVEEFPLDRWDDILSINLSAAFVGIRHCLPGMRERGYGRIINVASVHGLVASVEKSAYVAAKHGIVGLTKVVALETAGSGVTCNAICPGWVLTPLVQKQIDDLATSRGLSVEAATADLLREKQPSGKFATPEEIGALAAFLCRPLAASITGTTLPVDGGWTAR
jgi:3-hydroxybutyrate dehydrogenase